MNYRGGKCWPIPLTADCRHIAPDDIPGMALRICHKGETLYDRGFGFRDFEQKKPMGADTICRIYSMTKR